ncbi:polysaccharide biosynthesis/export family protein [Tsuneonella mangrovi]|uniref:polysaccharide biosynthesis/export family protein n=1 Tax=Tsuneonella mangrovi TaxID=1982042 RepID=UPI001F0AC575|nr:polysaccharide biosynthesis/export family protein [Tsuneonella mangrovi]
MTLLASGIVALSGCVDTPSPQAGAVNAVAVSDQGQADFSSKPEATYLLKPADSISLIVFREPDLSLQSVAIGVDGTISFPLLGKVQAAGLTTAQLADKIQQELGDGYLKDPHVAVNVIDYGSHVVTVEGAVKKAGIYNYQPGTRLSGAIALAEGTSNVAKLRDVAIFRQRPDGIWVAKFDYREVVKGTMIDPLIAPGDRVVVGTSALSQAWQDTLKALPAFAIFTRL